MPGVFRDLRSMHGMYFIEYSSYRISYIFLCYGLTEAVFCVCCCREEKLKARGLDPKEISEAAGDDTSPKIIDRLLSENKQQANLPKPSRTSNKLVDDNDLPPSTPAASPLNVPTVTHTSKGGGAHQLHDERNKNITTRVSAFIIVQKSRQSPCKS